MREKIKSMLARRNEYGAVYQEPTDKEVLIKKLEIIHWERSEKFPHAKFREILKEIKLKDDGL